MDNKQKTHKKKFAGCDSHINQDRGTCTERSEMNA
jgi:hypothetical protein